MQLGGLQHLLKLRTRQQLRNNLFAELGADLNASKMKVIPSAALEYRVISHLLYNSIYGQKLPEKIVATLSFANSSCQRHVLNDLHNLSRK